MPSFFKFNLTLILLALGGYLIWPMIMSLMGGEMISMGFPLATRRLNLATDSVADFATVNFFAVVVNIVFWYLASSVVALRYSRDELQP